MIPQLYFKAVKDHFGCARRAWRWFQTPLPEYGLSPLSMIKEKKETELLYVISKLIDRE